MIQNNTNTTPEQRFYFPDTTDIEYHESFSLDGLPTVAHLQGSNHYVVSERPDGERIANTLFWESYTLAPGSIVRSIQSLSEQTAKKGYHPSEVEQEAFSIFDPAMEYVPEPGTQMMVQAHNEWGEKRIKNPDFAKSKIAVLPTELPLPSFEDEGLTDREIRFRLLGFISVGDVFTTWKSPMSYDALLVNWSVIDQHVKNRVEEALLIDAIPHELSIIGLLSTHPAAKGYLSYFDAKHGTDYTPISDFKWPYREHGFPAMTDDQRAVYYKRLGIDV